MLVCDGYWRRVETTARKFGSEHCAKGVGAGKGAAEKLLNLLVHKLFNLEFNWHLRYSYS